MTTGDTTSTAELTSRQPPTVAEVTAAASRSPTLPLNVVDTPTRGRRRSSSAYTLSPPTLSSAYTIEQSQSVPVRIGVLHRCSVDRSVHPVCRQPSGRVVMAVQVHPLAQTLKLITLQPGLLSISLGRLRQAKRLCRLIHAYARFLVYRWLPRFSRVAYTLRLRVRIRDRILRYFQAT